MRSSDDRSGQSATRPSSSYASSRVHGHPPNRRRLRAPGAFALVWVAAFGTALQAQEQPVDREYTDAIHRFTTEPFFLTPWVDHLPASETVPTPLDVLGHIAGAADVLSYPEEIYGYMRAVADASPRVQVRSIGTTEEGREMILVLVGSEENLARLDEHRDAIARLGDPRLTTEAEAEALIESTIPMYWATGAIHSPETGSPEMLMELVYRLAVEETPFIQAIRDDLIFMATPVIEVDGRAKVVDLAMGPRKDPSLRLPGRPLFWGQYVAHDNNRDGMSLSLALSRNVVDTYLEYRPIVFHDLHESASHLYTSTGRGPYNAWVDPIVISEWNRLAYREVDELTALGVPGVYTHDFYDGWAPNYMFWVAHLHNGIGRFYETQGAGDGSTRIIRTNVERQWSRPNTPLPEVVWSIRNNVNLQQSALLVALNEVATNRREYVENFWKKSQRSVAKATAEGPAAYVFPADDDRPGQQARLLRLLQDHGMEVHRAEAAFSAGEREFGAGSYVVRMDQPFSRGADMLLDRQYYNPNDPSPYDDVGWTLGALHDVESVRVEDVAVLDVAMALVDGEIRDAGGTEGPAAARAWLVDYDADNDLAAFRFAHPDLRIEAAESAFTVGGRSFRAGSFIIQGEGADAGSLAEAGRRYGFTAVGVDAPPRVATHPVETPRVAIMHTWTTTQNEGWLRVGMDEYGVPYDYVSVHDIRDEPDLKSRWDVILFGPATSNALAVVEGIQGPEPIAWQASEATPNIGRQASTADMRGGLGLEGVLNLRRFVEAGGVFVAIASSASLPTHFGLAGGVQIVDTPDLWARGGVFRTTVTDHASPITYGYGDELGVYFNSAPVFRAGGGFGGFGDFGGFGSSDEDMGGAGSTTARRTGRGGLAEDDIVQGRPRDLGAAGVAAFREQSGEDAGGGRGQQGGAANRPRTLLAYHSDVEKLLISGGLRGGEALAGTPALMDVSLGDGHVILFSFNPFWRSETLGSYALVFNTIMHYRALGAGRPMTTDR